MMMHCFFCSSVHWTNIQAKKEQARTLLNEIMFVYSCMHLFVRKLDLEFMSFGLFKGGLVAVQWQHYVDKQGEKSSCGS